MRAKSMILIFVALGCGLVASYGISQVLRQQDPGGKTNVETAPILVSLTDIDIGEEFTPQNVELEEWPRDRIPPGSISSLEDLVDRYPRQRLYVGEPILEAKLMDSNSKQGAESLTIPEGFRVAAIKVEVDSGLGGLVSPGDRVDVIAYLRRGPEIDQTMSRTILRDVRVFAVDQKTTRDTDADGNVSVAKTLSLLVKRNQVERLSLAAQLGKLRLSLRRPNEEDDGEGDMGATVEDLMGKPAEDGDPEPTGPSIAQPSTPPPSGGGLLDMLGQATPAPATDLGLGAPLDPLPVAPAVTHSMIIRTPEGAMKYSWHEGNDEPVSEPLGGFLPPAAPVPALNPTALDGATGQPEASSEEEEVSLEQLLQQPTD